MPLYDFTVYDSLVRSATIYKDRTAIVDGDERLTYVELLDLADRLAAGLHSMGVEKADRIAVISQNCSRYLVTLCAAAKLGAIAVPINWRFQAEEIEYVLQDTSPKALLAHPDFIETASSLAQKLDFVQTRISLGGAGNGFAAFESALKPVGAPAPVHDRDDFVIIHTAAVAGKPRGAVLSHKNFVATNQAWMETMLLNERDVHLNVLPLFHIAGLVIATTMVHCGGVNVIMPKFEADSALELIEQESVSVFFSFPPIIARLLEGLQKKSYDVSSLRHVGGLESPENIEAFQKQFQAQFWVGYGQTETMGFTTFSPYSERPGSAGKAGPTTVIKLMDDYDNETSPGEPGEICVRGHMIFNGYWNLEEDTQHAFREGWHHTGDVGRFDEDGYLFYVKRKAEKELIKPGGENVYPAEVEKAILDHPDVNECSVIGVPDEQWGEAIKAICVKNAESALTEREIIDFVASKIARYKKPKHVVFVDALPKTDEGAVDRETIKKDHGGQY